MVKKDKVAKAIALGAIVIGSLAAGGLGGALMFPKVIVEEKIVTDTITLPGEIVEKIVEVPVEVNQTVFVDKEVCTPELNYLTERLEDKGIFDDAKEIVRDLKAEDSARDIAVQYIEDNYADELEDAGFIGNDRDAKLISIYTDVEDIDVLKSDYDDSEYKFDIKVKIENTDSENKKKYIYTVKVEDGEAQIKNIVIA